MGKILLLASMLAIAVLISGCVQQPPSNNLPPSGENKVTISGFAFIPQALTIKVGETVTWVNEDSALHRIASNPHPAHTDLPELVSPDLAQGQSYSFNFTKTGIFGYHCHLHPNMQGTITVEE